jgi:olefin beta-lactone synthetase
MNAPSDRPHDDPSDRRIPIDGDPVTNDRQPTTDRSIAQRLVAVAASRPDQLAIAEPLNWKSGRRPDYRTIRFDELQQQTDAIAHGLYRWGIRPGMRLAMLVPFGLDFITVVLGVLKSGATLVLIDPGIGRKHLIQCLADARPDGFVAIPRAQAIRTLLRHRFPQARWNVTLGRRWFWGGKTLASLADQGSRFPQSLPKRSDEDLAAIIFTTGSTGPPKGVQYTHGTFQSQVDLIQQQFGIEPGGRDLACFPLFGLFDAFHGVTTIIPPMDPTRPAAADPAMLLDAIDRWQVDQTFASPALWTNVVRYCQRNGRSMPTVRRVLSAGAPVAPRVLEGLMPRIHPDGQLWTPYGATEALPIASIEAREILNETSLATLRGAGTCVGKRFPTVQWRVIAIDDRPIATIEESTELPCGEIGELMVCGPMVSRAYETRVDQNAIHKVRDGAKIWHRMGDVGYLDASDRFWYCGRKSHRVQTATTTLFTEPCEAVFASHPHVHRAALIGIGDAGSQHPVIVIEAWPEHRPCDLREKKILIQSLRELAAQYAHTAAIDDIRIAITPLPVDIRHNAKIFRERIVPPAQESFGNVPAASPN